MRARHGHAVIAVAMFALSSCGGGGSTSAGLRIDPALLALVPADALTLAGGRWDKLRESPLYSKLEPLLPGEGAGGLQERLGVDPNKGLREFLLAHNGKTGVAFARVTFDTSQVAERLVKEGAERSSYAGKTILTKGGAGIALLADGIIAAGPLEELRGAIDRAAQGKAAPPERLVRSLTALPGPAQLYFTGGGGATLNFPRGSNAGNFDKVLAALDSATVYADLSRGFRISANGQCVDGESAKKLHTQIRGLIGMGRLSTPDNQPELLRLFDAIQTKVTDKSIQLDIELPLEQAEKAVAALSKSRQ